MTHLRDLLLELGRGFSFVGSQVPLIVDGQTFYIDLLFYHVRLHCYFVFELKVGAFQPEHAGKLGFYLAAVNRTMRTPVEGPSIGVLLCESRSGPMVEFALENHQSADRRLHVSGDPRAAGAHAGGAAQRRGPAGGRQQAPFGDGDVAEGADR